MTLRAGLLGCFEGNAEATEGTLETSGHDGRKVAAIIGPSVIMAISSGRNVPTSEGSFSQIAILLVSCCSAATTMC